MNIWLVTVGEPLPTDSEGCERLLRTGILANILVKAGHSVLWWNSTFNHTKKEHRSVKDELINLSNSFSVQLLRGCGYNKNVSLTRIIDHFILARKFTKLSKQHHSPDLILCSFPPIELANAVTKYGKINRVPVFVDIRDLWPDLFEEVLPPVKRFLCKPLLSWMNFITIETLKRADGILGNSDGFVGWGLKKAGRIASDLDSSFPHGYSDDEPSGQAKVRSLQFWRSHGISKDDRIFTACFFGAIGTNSRIELVIEAAKKLDSKYFRFIICGKGDLSNHYKTDVSVIFPGWVNASDIWTLMRMSNVGLVLYSSNVGYVSNMPNKPIEYLSAGLPLVSCLEGFLKDFIEQYKCGINFNPSGLSDTLIQLRNNPDLLSEMSNNARNVFLEKFEAKKIYSSMIDHLLKALRSSNTHLKNCG